LVKWSRASVLPRVSPRPKRGGLLSPSRASRVYREMKWRPVRALLPSRRRKGLAAVG
jgi:hypothetical protein